MKDLLDYIQESLYQDLCYTYNVIDESGGLYDGQIDLAAKITNDIVNNNGKQDFTLTYANVGLNNEYFNKLIVDVNLWRKTSVNASIDLYGNLESDDPYKKYNYDKSSDKLDIVTITISCNYDTSIYSDVIMSRISHELNHGYVYWQTIKDDFKENDKTVPEEIHSKLHEWSNTIYKKIASNIINPTNDEASQIAYNLIYTLTRYERNAFLAEIVTYLYDNNGKLKDIDNAKQLLSKSSQYRLYAEEGPEIIDIMKNEWDDKRALGYVSEFISLLQYLSDSRLITIHSNKESGAIVLGRKQAKWVRPNYIDVEDALLEVEGNMGNWFDANNQQSYWPNCYSEQELPIARYLDCSLSVSQELKDLVKNDFKTEEQIRFEKQQRLTWISIAVAGGIGIASLIMSVMGLILR